MGNIVITACLLVLMIIFTIVYVILIGSAFPKFILKEDCSEKGSRDRGLKKYLFPSGRGVVYVPHAGRKYVESYVLFSHGGYKYLKCRLCEGVREIKYHVVMYSNEDKILDVIEVDELINGGCETDSILIHQETSYISLILNSVNGNTVNDSSLFYCKIRRLGIYASAVSLLSFAQFAFLLFALRELENIAYGQVFISEISLWVFIIPALIIGGISALWVYRRSRARGLRWLK